MIQLILFLCTIASTLPLYSTYHVESESPTIIPTTTSIIQLTNLITNYLDKEIWQFENSHRYKSWYQTFPTIHVSFDPLRAFVDVVLLRDYNLKEDSRAHYIINKASQSNDESNQLDAGISKIFQNLIYADNFFNDFRIFFRRRLLNDAHRCKFLHTLMFEDYTDVHKLVNEIHTNLIGTEMSDEYDGVLSLFMRNFTTLEIFLQDRNMLTQTPGQYLNNLLSDVLKVEIQGQIILKYAAKFLKGKCMVDTRDISKRIAAQEFGARINRTLAAFKEILAYAERDVSNSYPDVTKEGTTFEELKRVFKNFILDLNYIEPKRACDKGCPAFNKVPKDQHNVCLKPSHILFWSLPEPVCHFAECDGILHECDERPDTLTVCPVSQRGDPNANRYYSFIEKNAYEYGGPRNKCPTKTVEVEKYSLRKFIADPLELTCHPCMCVCANQGPTSEGSINLRLTQSTVSENYVVTGVRFVKHRGALHIQLQEGKLLPNGQIDSFSLQWIKLDEDDSNNFQLDWETAREIYLDDITAPKGHVLVGLGFKVETDKSLPNQPKKRFRLEACTAPMNISGTVSTDKVCFGNQNIWTSPEISLENLDIPTRQRSHRDITISKPKRHLKLSITGVEQDAGQTTIPFIDIQSVATNPPAPMSGVGLYHENLPGDGGFLALRLFTYDYSQDIQADLPENFNDFDS